MLALMADVIEPHTWLVSVTVLVWMSQYRLRQAFLMEAIGRSAMSTNRSQARMTSSGLRRSGCPSDPYTHSMAKVLDEPFMEYARSRGDVAFLERGDLRVSTDGGGPVRMGLGHALTGETCRLLDVVKGRSDAA